MSIKLRVGGLAPSDAGRGIARLSQSARGELGVTPGDVVELQGQRRTTARVLPAYSNDHPEVIRVDGTVRANAGASIDDRITVSSAEAEPAQRITVALPPYMRVRGVEPHIQRVLRDRPVLRGDTVRVNILGRPFPFVVVGVSPSDIGIGTQNTEVTIRDEPVTEADLRGEQTDMPEVTYEDLGGLTDELEQVREMIELPMRHPELFRKLGIAPPKGVLLHGPPGTGKTLLARAVADEVDAHFESISGPEIMSKYYGESEQHLREIFETAEENAPAIIFIDEIDSIAPNRDQVAGEVERRVVAQLLTLMDGLDSRGDVIVIAATNRVNSIDSALRRGGRFDREIEIGVPDQEGRHEILQIHTRGMPLGEEVDLDALATQTYGFVGADLESLAKEAAMNSLRRIRDDIDLDAEIIPSETLDTLEVTATDFDDARANTEPSAMREAFVEVPSVTYDEVGGLNTVKQELVRAVEWPLTYPTAFKQLHTRSAGGILLYGPPGTGKTLLAKAVANATNANFISVKGPELLDKYVGESERAVREVFHRARQNAPSIVFFDEIDAIAPERGGSSDSRVTERVVSQLLTELDGVEELSNVVVIGATNRPDILDRALLRPNRLEKVISVPLPDTAARKAIFQVHTSEVPLSENVDLDKLAGQAEGYTGSDIEAIVREASVLALDDYIASMEDHSIEEIEASSSEIVVEREHFAEAIAKTTPSVTPSMREHYNDLAEELGGEISTNADDSWIGFQ